MYIASTAEEISIHALRVEGDLAFTVSRKFKSISIHALRVEGALLPGLPDVRMCRISIHALRVEGDVASPFMDGGVG